MFKKLYYITKKKGELLFHIKVLILGNKENKYRIKKIRI